MNAIKHGPAIVRLDTAPKGISVPVAGRLSDGDHTVPAVWSLAEECPVSVLYNSEPFAVMMLILYTLCWQKKRAPNRNGISTNI